MKKVLIGIMVLIAFIANGCKNKDDNYSEIPSKISANDNSPITSPINTINLDNYMFREDVQYIDLRATTMVVEEGYVAGFEFIPFVSIIASFEEQEALYQMKRVIDSEGKIHAAGQIGGFVAQYEESENVINSIFDKNKYIFLISQGGSEGAYVINLLIQLGYDGDLLYNVGGVSNSEGVESYRSIENNKYYVNGQGNYFDVSIEYNFLKDLTPIN